VGGKFAVIWFAALSLDFDKNAWRFLLGPSLSEVNIGIRCAHAIRSPRTEVGLGRIIHGDVHGTLKVKIEVLAHEVGKRIEKITGLLSDSSPPDLVLNRHCVECEFRDACSQKAIPKDHATVQMSENVLLPQSDGSCRLRSTL
jgi:hypothetical protein